MNRPNFASRNHAIFSSCDAGAGSGGGSCVKVGTLGAELLAQLPHCACLVAQPQVKHGESEQEETGRRRISVWFSCAVDIIMA